MITHSNEIEREIYQLERELQTAIMNDRDWDIDRLKNEISELEAELDKYCMLGQSELDKIYDATSLENIVALIEKVKTII